MFLAANTKEEVPDFKIKGSWFERSCTIYLGDTSNIIAQVRLLILLLYFKKIIRICLVTLSIFFIILIGTSYQFRVLILIENAY